MKTKIILLSFLIAFLLLGSCGQKKEKFADNYLSEPRQEYSSDEIAIEESGQKATSAYAENKKADMPALEQNTPQSVTEKIPQKIIKTADISFKVDKYDEVRTEILAIIKKHNGYVASENQTGDEYRTTNVMIIRVDAENFDALVDNLLKEAVFVDYKKINSEDVTEEFVDINARLKSKKDAMLQYETILKKAYSVNDILEVQQYIRTLQEEIESLEGRLKYLSNKVALSTINLTFYEQGNILPAQSEGFGYKLKKALSWGWQGLVTFFLAIIYLWPLWIICLVTLYIVRHFVKKARKKRAAKLLQQQQK